MTFNEMKELYDKDYNAHYNWMTVERAKILGDIGPEYHNIFPNSCECGSENIITFNLSTMRCCDPRCSVKQAYALSEMMDRFDIRGVGIETCKTIYAALKKKDQELKSNGEEGLLKTNSYVEILLVPYESYPFYLKGFSSTADFCGGVYAILNKKLTFPQIIARLGLPELDTSSSKLFDGINSFNQFSEIVNSEGGLRNYCANRGVYSAMSLFWLNTSLEDIYLASYIFRSSIKQQGLIKIGVCLTGRLFFEGNSITKEAFLNLCNEQAKSSDGTQLLEFYMCSAEKTAPYIIYSVKSTDRKYMTGLSRGIERDEDGTERKVLVNTSEFMDIVKKMTYNLNKQYENFKKEEHTCQTEHLEEASIF